MEIIDGPIIATPSTSPFGLKSSIPTTLIPLVIAIIGRPVDTGVGSVTSIFICAIPPGGAVSSGMCSEICRVPVDVQDPPLVEPEVPLEELLPDPPLVDPDVPWARACPRKSTE